MEDKEVLSQVGEQLRAMEYHLAQANTLIDALRCKLKPILVNKVPTTLAVTLEIRKDDNDEVYTQLAALGCNIGLVCRSYSSLEQRLAAVLPYAGYVSRPAVWLR